MVESEVAVDTAAAEDVAAAVEDMASVELRNKVVVVDHRVVKEELLGQGVVVYRLLSSV